MLPFCKRSSSTQSVLRFVAARLQTELCIEIPAGALSYHSEAFPLRGKSLMLPASLVIPSMYSCSTPLDLETPAGTFTYSVKFDVLPGVSVIETGTYPYPPLNTDAALTLFPTYAPSSDSIHMSVNRVGPKVLNFIFDT